MKKVDRQIENQNLKLSLNNFSMEREKVIAQILKYGDLYSEIELQTYTNIQLCQILGSLFIALRIKRDCDKTKNQNVA